MQVAYVCYTDMNECDEVGDNGHRCQAICINTVGSYTCSCDDGYRLADDERTCEGKWKAWSHRKVYIGLY